MNAEELLRRYAAGERNFAGIEFDLKYQSLFRLGLCIN